MKTYSQERFHQSLWWLKEMRNESCTPADPAYQQALLGVLDSMIDVLTENGKAAELFQEPPDEGDYLPEPLVAQAGDWTRTLWEFHDRTAWQVSGPDGNARGEEPDTETAKKAAMSMIKELRSIT